MRFQIGQSGNPAGRPPGALNKKTLALEAELQEQALEAAKSLIERAKNGDLAAMRMCLDRFAPTGRNRPVAIELPVIKTPEDAELALTVVTDELAAGELSISEATLLVTLIERMLRVAERMWKFQRACRDAAAADQEATEAQAEAAQTAEKPAASLYSPVNSEGPATEAASATSSSVRETGPARPNVPREDRALPHAA
ncbi:MAG: hypothetical protein JO328_14210 [Hyphomicrobiales bacterium]|nr:hypothetical protein [Hyphomicrobiales bacterium]MBV8824649.1 hypothetical protein [Hyphomicrobiales bacterium]